MFWSINLFFQFVSSIVLNMSTFVGLQLSECKPTKKQQALCFMTNNIKRSFNTNSICKSYVLLKICVFVIRNGTIQSSSIKKLPVPMCLDNKSLLKKINHNLESLLNKVPWVTQAPKCLSSAWVPKYLNGEASRVPKYPSALWVPLEVGSLKCPSAFQDPFECL